MNKIISGAIVGVITLAPVCAFAQATDSNASLIAALEQLIVILTQELNTLIAQKQSEPIAAVNPNAYLQNPPTPVIPVVATSSAPTCVNTLTIQPVSSTNPFLRQSFDATYSSSCSIDPNTPVTWGYQLSSASPNGTQDWNSGTTTIGQWLGNNSANGIQQDIGVLSNAKQFQLEPYSQNYTGSASTTVTFTVSIGDQRGSVTTN